MKLDGESDSSFSIFADVPGALAVRLDLLEPPHTISRQVLVRLFLFNPCLMLYSCC